MLKSPEPLSFNRRRMTAVLLALIVIIVGYAGRLFQIQIVQGDYYAGLAAAESKTTITIAASRGEIVDCHQIPLVSNRTSYAVVLDDNYFPRGNTEEGLQARNECLLALTRLLTEQGETWNDTLPIGRELPYAFDEEREAGVSRLKTYLRLAGYATADNCMQEMTDRFALSGYGEEDRRTLAGIHYEMATSGFNSRTPYTFASGISDTAMYRILENSARFPGVNVETVAVREYVGGTTACHIIGSVGPIYAEEYDELKDKGYSYNDIVGKSGIEAAAESSLRGTAGKRTITKDAQGVITAEEETVAPIPGQTTILTLDSRVQQAAQQALDEKITSLRATAAKGKGKDVKSGAVVLLDVKTGGVKVCASWPDYDLSTYMQNYTELLENPDNPLFNRALYGAFPCGSTFKPGMALAAVTEGVIRPDTVIRCTHKYMYYAPSYTPNCMGYHNSLTVPTAIQKSCNYYFYEVGRLINSRIFRYLDLYGFGQKTGVEIGESSGIQLTPEYMQSTGSTWVPGDYLQLAIGQRGSYTPIQLAAYAMMIANNGVRYKTHFIKALRSYDTGADTVTPTEIAAQVEWSKEAIDAVHQGMLLVGKAGTASAYFSHTPYTVACKTGTAQTGINGATDHGTFIAYAPADDPEIALAVVIERGTSGASTAVGRKVLDAYFAGKESGETPTPNGELLP